MLAGLSGILVAADAFNIFVFMEISSLASYVLIAGGPDRRALPATFKYLIMGTIGATFYLIGVGLIYMMTGTLNLADMELRIHEVADQKPILAAAGFITVGLALKAAMFPLHVWLPNAYTYAPHIVTAFMAACATKVSLYVLLRFDFFVFQENQLVGIEISVVFGVGGDHRTLKLCQGFGNILVGNLFASKGLKKESGVVGVILQVTQVRLKEFFGLKKHYIFQLPLYFTIP